MSLNYATYYKHVEKPKHYLYLRSFTVFIYGNLASKYYVQFYNQFQNVLRLFNVLPNFPFTTS